MDRPKLIERLYEIGLCLAALHREQGATACSLAAIEINREQRELELLPPDGRWPGKNDDDRRLARTTAYRQDNAWKTMDNRLAALRAKQMIASAKIAALEAERRGLEYTVKLMVLADREQAEAEAQGG